MTLSDSELLYSCQTYIISDEIRKLMCLTLLKKSIDKVFNKTKQYQHDEHRIHQRFQVCLYVSPTSYRYRWWQQIIL